MLPTLFRPDADNRKHQINTLKVFNDNVSEIAEGLEYNVSFNCGGNDLSLNVLLGKNFPKEKPIIKISPSVIHPWVNVDGEVHSAPGLLNFTVNSDLGRVVQAIIREFQRTPPPLLSPNNDIGHFSPTNMPIVIFPELSKLSLADLKFLAENTDRQDDFLDQLPYIKEQNKMLDESILKVEELAQANLSKQTQLDALRQSLDARIEEVTKLAFENERLHVVYQNLSDKYSPRNIQEELRLAAEKADTESDSIANSFLKGEIDVDKFLSQFIKVKTLSQSRKTKEEKLSHQLDNFEKAGF